MGRIPERYPMEPPAPHKISHQDGGDDELSVAGLSGELSDDQPTTWDKVSNKPTAFTPEGHHESHQDGGDDELSVAGLSGELSDDQPTTWGKVSNKPTAFTPEGHHESHEPGGDDEIIGLTGVPAGVICMWSGAIINIPAGWALCDGGGGRPDLRDKFIIGAGNSYAVNQTGGALTHSHGVTDYGHLHGIEGNTDDALTEVNTEYSWTGITAYDVGHSHVLSTGDDVGEGEQQYRLAGTDTGTGYADISINDDGHSHSIPSLNHSHSFSISTSQESTGITINNGGGEPPYYALAFIIKT